MPDFGQAVQEFRRSKRYDRYIFSGKLGVSPAYLGQIERGEVPPPYDSLAKRINIVFGWAVQMEPWIKPRIPVETITLKEDYQHILDAIAHLEEVRMIDEAKQVLGTLKRLKRTVRQRVYYENKGRSKSG